MNFHIGKARYEITRRGVMDYKSVLRKEIVLRQVRTNVRTNWECISIRYPVRLNHGLDAGRTGGRGRQKFGQMMSRLFIVYRIGLVALSIAITVALLSDIHAQWKFNVKVFVDSLFLLIPASIGILHNQFLTKRFRAIRLVLICLYVLFFAEMIILWRFLLSLNHPPGPIVFALLLVMILPALFFSYCLITNRVS